jgi:membrane associated rhomboid family serine protease
MFIPLHDDTPLKVIRLQYVTLAIIALNVLVFLLTGAMQSEETLFYTAAGFGVVPVELTGGLLEGALDPVPDPATLLTYQFLHAGWMHLLSNMLFLWVFADNVEDAYGHFMFPLFYLITGAVGGATHVMVQPASANPLIGASGAVAGVLAAYLVLFPKARIWVLLFLRIPWRFSAWMVLCGWFALQIVSLYLNEGEDVAVAWWAHIGGFVSGLIMTLLFRRVLLARIASA